MSKRPKYESIPDAVVADHIRFEVILESIAREIGYYVHLADAVDHESTDAQRYMDAIDGLEQMRRNLSCDSPVALAVIEGVLRVAGFARQSDAPSGVADPGLSAPHSVELTDDQNGERFERIIFPSLYRHVHPVDSPTVQFFAAQPGAGKSVIQSRVRDQLVARDGSNSVMTIGTDVYRPYHPAYCLLIQEDTEKMASLTNPDTRKWMDCAIAYAQRLRSHVLLNTAFKNPEKVQALARRYRTKGFDTHFHLIAVNELVSRTRAIGLYLDRIALYGPERYVPPAADGAAYKQIPSILDSLVDSGQFSSITLYDLNGELLTTLGSSDAAAKLETLEILRKVSTAPVDPSPLIQQLEQWQRAASTRNLNCKALHADIEELIQRIGNQ
ncbi:zeta toxin family protein [Rudaeicoccus suwonensis]|uniref:UDP-N-acetylglucosamine kinase n=1 Tax=Rudaeicoccus suwonensis TaxID=657409 RepID=A0A561E819_9MICO|nr:zeta toxin family protein [Rudaeicoccus suwonensis]TWE11762.1 zeta toxin [Rudaeicoccus suwonensis]